MSNPSDPKKSNPDSPDPKKKPGDAENAPGTPEHSSMERSSFDFVLPPEAGSFSDLPPVGQPDASDSGTFKDALPPRPEAAQRPSNVSFDFIDLPPAGAKPGTGLHNVPATPTPIDPVGTSAPPPVTPNLPPSAVPMASATDDEFDFGSPLPTAEPVSSKLGMGTPNLATLPEVPTAEPASGVKSVPDISTLFPPATPIPEVPEVPAASLAPSASDLPVAQPLSGVSIGSTADLPIAQPASDVFGSGDLELPLAQPLSDQNLSPLPPVVPTTPTPDFDELLELPQDLPPEVVRTATPTPDLDAVFGDLPPVTPVEPVSGWISSGTSDPGTMKTVEPPAAEEFPVADVEPIEAELAEPEPPAAPTGPERPVTDRSSFDFELPSELKTFSDLPPVHQPDANETGTFNAALPPRPVATQPSSTPSFDFIELPPEDASGSGVKSGTSLHDIPAAPTPIDTAEPPAVTATPTPDLDSVLGSPHDLPEAARTTTPTPDLDAEMAELTPANPVDAVEPASGWLTSGKSDPGTMKTVEPPAAEEVPVAEAEPIEAELAEAEPIEAELAEPEPAAPAEPERTPTGRSSFEFTLSQGDMDPVQLPEGDETGNFSTALPPLASGTRRPTNVSFDFIDLAPEDGSGSGLKPGTGLQNIPATPMAIDTDRPPLTPTSDAVILPPVQDPDAANLDALDSVKPASGWLDSGILSGPGAADLISSDPLSGSPAQGVESSDIFSGSRTRDALPVEQSDVIAATAYGSLPPAADQGAPSDNVRPSEVALTFDGPPGGSTMQDSGASDLPLADEVAGSSALLGGGRADPESIHDMPGMTVPNSAFDSSQLPQTPELPRKQPDDAPNYGQAPSFSPDASSILADLSEADLSLDDDSSSVRVESPGVNRTLTGGPADGGFDLTVPDEPIPVDLFDEPGEEGTVSDATDWQQESGSDLFADRRKSPEVDLDATGRVEPVDADLVPDQPSLTSAPSSIFSGGKPPPGSSSTGSGRVRIGAQPPADEPADADAVEFTDHPELSDTAERAAPELPANLKSPRRPTHGLSSADFTLPPEATTPQPVPAAADDGGGIDWDAVSLSDDDNATRGIPRDASLSSIMRGLTDESTEDGTREKPVPPETKADSVPSVTVDWMAGSVEGKALGEETTDPELEDRINKRRAMQEQEAKAKPTKPTKPEKKKPAAVVTPTAETRVKPMRGAAVPTAPVAVADSAETGEKVTPKAKGKDKEKPAKKGGGMLVGLLLGAILAGGVCAGAYFGGVVPNGDPQAKQLPNTGDDGKGKGNNPTTDAKTALASGDVGKALELLKDKTPETTDEKAIAGSVRFFSVVSGTGNASDGQKAETDLKAVIADPEAMKPENVQRTLEAAVRLGALYEKTGRIEEAKQHFTEMKAKFPAYKTTFDVHLDRLSDGPADPGTSFRLTPAEIEQVLLCTILLQDGAPKADDPEEAGLYYWKAMKLAREGKYKEAIDTIKQAKEAHVKRAKALAGRGLNPLTDPLEQMFPRACDELIAYWTMKAELYRNPDIADAAKKNELGKKLDSLAKAEKDLKGAMDDLKTAKDDLKKSNDDLKTAKDDLKKSGDDLKTAKDDLKKSGDDLKTAKDDLKTAKDDLKTSADKLTVAEKDAKDRGDLLAMLVTELKPVVAIPEKWAPADLVGGVKNLVSFAKEKDVKTLLERVTKAETTAKTAVDKLKTETEKITTKYEADIKKIKDDNTADAKKLTDKYEADIKKLIDDYKADVKKMKDDNAAAIKAEQEKTDAEKKAAAAAAISFQKQLGNAVTPSQALDIWLPMLTKLRNPADADPATVIAKRALASSAPDSDDEAKAHATIGMALLLKGDYSGAKDEFQIARRSPAYKPEKPWAKVVDEGLEAVVDPLSPYRTAVVLPPINLTAAAKSLDAGISAYRAGRYKAAEAALLEAAKNDSHNPVTWYFLGAARWAIGDDKQALKDFAQGAEREKLSPNPARTISEAIAPLQGAVRDAIDKVRP